MKLYATITSERASKAQGGEYLDIEVKDETQTVIAEIKVRKYDLHTAIDVWHGGAIRVSTYKDKAMDTTKGKQ